MENLPDVRTAFGKKPPEAELRRETKTEIPDLRKLKDRLVRSQPGVR
ncbi:MAG: hypothetical protein LBR86_08145 [Tannerella sp.]|nr:hypothetical protein [Tannerella sp.]